MPKRESQVLAFALSLPESWEDHPWGETVAKVGAKVFVFLGGERITVKLDESHAHALSIEGGVPAGYGLGKAGWVTVPLAKVPLDVLRDWVEESYRIAPRSGWSRHSTASALAAEGSASSVQRLFDGTSPQFVSPAARRCL